MKRGLLVLLVTAFLATATAGLSAPLRVLYFTKSSGWEHSVVQRVNGQPSFSDRIVAELGARHGWVVTCSKDGSLFSADYFRQFDVLVFFTSGDLSAIGPDGAPGVTAEGKAALLAAIETGRGFVGLHSTCDTYHDGEFGPGLPADIRHRYHDNGTATDPFLRMLGAEFLRHGRQQEATVRVVDRAFPGCAEMADTFTCMEEWYSLKFTTRDLHALLILETRGMLDSDYARPAFPLAWARRHGSGRVWVNAMGHREDVWESRRFQAMLVGGVEWAAGRRDADVSPNFDQVAPGGATLPPPPPPSGE